MSPSERRRFPRIAHPFIVRYRFPHMQDAAWRAAPVRNLSGEGACFRCEYAFVVGHVVELQLSLPTSKQPIPLRGRIIWAKLVNPTLNLYEYGVVFDAIDAATRQLIAETVTAFLRKQQTQTDS